MEQVVYTELFLTGRVLKWFKPYFTEIQLNGMSTTNVETRYIFSIQDGFANQLKQIFGSLKEKSVAKDKFKNI